MHELNFIQSANRVQFAQFCPCGKSNKDGKFHPYEQHHDKGYCFACDKTFLPEKEHRAVRKKATQTTKIKPISNLNFLPSDLVEKSQVAFDRNNFVTFLRKHFGEYRADMLIKTYGIGTSKKFKNESGYSTVFWYQDAQKRLRSGKIMLYDADSGKRVKEPYNRISWIHKEKPTGIAEHFEYRACLFGEHLVPDNQQKPIAIVESEKSAIIASVYLPEYLWLASGGISNLRAETVQILKGQNVVLFPDVDGYEQWKVKAEIIAEFATVSIYQHLERQADDVERSAKYDIADYLLRILPPPQEYTVEYEQWCIETDRNLKS